MAGLHQRIALAALREYSDGYFLVELGRVRGTD
jgi:hypothetical protein